MCAYKLPLDYKSILDEKETQRAIVMIKDTFQLVLSTNLNLTRVTAPLFLQAGLGLNDDLNGTEHPVKFSATSLDNATLEIVHSLAKWKRVKVTQMQLKPGFGIYADMNAIRADEVLDAVHSLYVDQWDWCMVMDEKDRTIMTLKDNVRKLYQCLKQTEFYIYDRYNIEPILPENITFIYTDDLYRQYPDKSPKERENLICKQYGAVFLIGIGAKLPDGSIHDGRAPDYDDWISETGDGHHGLNGDLLVWNPVLECALELSSMGIRCNPQSLLAQLKERGCVERVNLQFHKDLLAGKLAMTMGGGIGQSRLCMYFLRKAHIGEIQVSLWKPSTRKECEEHNIFLL